MPGNDPFQRCVDDSYLRAFSDDIVELNDIVRTHPDTAIAHRQPDISFLRRPMNVDGAGEGARILRFTAA